MSQDLAHNIQSLRISFRIFQNIYNIPSLILQYFISQDLSHPLLPDEPQALPNGPADLRAQNCQLWVFKAKYEITSLQSGGWHWTWVQYSIFQICIQYVSGQELNLTVADWQWWLWPWYCSGATWSTKHPPTQLLECKMQRMADMYNMLFIRILGSVHMFKKSSFLLYSALRHTFSF